MAKMKIRANDKATDQSIDGSVAKIGLVQFDSEMHILFLDDEGFDCAKLGGHYADLRRFAEETIRAIDLLTKPSGVLQ